MRLRYAAWVALAAAIVALIGGVAYASIPAADGTINGCYKTNNPAKGAVIVIDSAESCPSGYTALNWNQTGPQGPAGVSGYEVVQNRLSFGAGVTSRNLTAAVNCPLGKVPLGGGVRLDAPLNPPWFVTLSQPWADNGDYLHPTGWFMEAQSSQPGVPTDSGMALTAYAICASVG